MHTNFSCHQCQPLSWPISPLSAINNRGTLPLLKIINMYGVPPPTWVNIQVPQSQINQHQNLILVAARRVVFKEKLSNVAVKRCPAYHIVNVQQSPSRPPGPCPSSPWKPHANFAAIDNTPTPTWLLDNGASHHVTSDLSNRSLHSPYSGSDDVMIGDGSSLQITHSSSTTLSTSSKTFQLTMFFVFLS